MIGVPELDAAIGSAGVDEWGAAACERQNASTIPTVGDICGVCLAVCPFGRRLPGRRSDTSAGDGPNRQTSPQAKEREWKRWSS